MKLQCSGYTKQSNICNCNIRERCPIAVIESDKASRFEVRCPRTPFVGDREHYVSHKTRVEG